MEDDPAAIPPDPEPVSLGGAATSEGRKGPAPRLRDALVPGSVLAGRYRIERFLARGGMGEVHEAHDELLDIAVALKTLRLDLEGDPVRLKHFKRELLLARSITHPNICRVHDLEVDRSTRRVLFFLTMELLAGETLRSRIVARGRLTPEEAFPLIRQIAAALGAAHAAGVVHGDFKSANVMLVPASGGERVVVTDFGLARLHEEAAAEAADLSQAEEVFGTPAYMSPEQTRGEPAGPASDLYSLGVVLFEMMTGRLPFEGAASIEMASRRLTEDPPSPASLVADLAPELAGVVARCLKREPGERYARAQDLLDALDGKQARPDVRATPCVLPAERDVFIGRSDELRALAQRHGEGARLVTILGPGGMGKTRFVTRYGWLRLEDWPGGVWFADLSGARSIDGIAASVAAALEVPLGKNDPLLQIGHAIAGRGRCLVILDNFEQVTEHAQATVGGWMERAAEAAFVVTSRERLSIPGEQVMPLEPLSPETEGVDLFVVRARAQKSDFALTEANRPVVRDIVRLLDALPLAIELAAARARVLAPEQLLARLGDRFQILVGARGAQRRQATLRAAIDSSWTLLAPWEQATLAQASVFAGGFTLEAAEAVFDLASWPQAPPAIDVVQALVDKSLLRPWTPTTPGRSVIAEPRFGMYVSIHEYAAEKLKTTGAIEDDANGPAVEQAALVRHGGYYARFGSEAAIEALDVHGGVARRRALGGEVENLVVACRRAIARGDGTTATAAVEALWAVRDLRGTSLAAGELGRDVLGVTSLGATERARASAVLGASLMRAGRVTDASRHLHAALGLAREAGNRRVAGGVLSHLGRLHNGQGESEQARGYLEESRAVCREIGNRPMEGRVLGQLAALCRHLGRVEEARRHYDEALAIARAVGNRDHEGAVLCDLGNLHDDQGRPEEARRHYEEALDIDRETGNRTFEGAVIGNLGGLHKAQGRMEEALRYSQDALAIAREVGNRRGEGLCLGKLGNLLLAQDRLEEAQQHLEPALAIAREVGDRGFEGEARLGLGRVHLGQGRLEEARQHLEPALAITREVGRRAYEEGEVLGLLGLLDARAGRFAEARSELDQGEALLRATGDRISLGEILCRRGEYECLAGDVAAARRALGAAEEYALVVDAGPDSPLAREIVKLSHALAAAPEASAPPPAAAG